MVTTKIPAFEGVLVSSQWWWFGLSLFVKKHLPLLQVLARYYFILLFFHLRW